MVAVSQKCFSHLSPIFALSLGLRVNRSDKTQALLGAGRRGEPGAGNGMVVTGLSCTAMLLHAPLPPLCSIGSLLVQTQDHIRALCLIPVEWQRWYRNRMGGLLLPLTADADGLCLPTSTSPNSYLRRAFFFFFLREKRGRLLKAGIFPAQIQNFLIFSWGLLRF